jgi:hypothetical protein
MCRGQNAPTALGTVETLLIAAALTWWPAYLFAGVIGGFGGALVGHGLQGIFKYDDDDDPLAAVSADGGSSIIAAKELIDVH